MIKKILIVILISSNLLALEYAGQKPLIQPEGFRCCSNGMCATASYSGSLIKLSCDHYFCGKCAQKSATKNKGTCAFCGKIMFDVSHIPSSLSYQLLISERDQETKPKQQSAFGGIIQDAFKVMIPDNPLVHAAPDAQQMFLALALERRYRIGDFYKQEPADTSASLTKAQVKNTFWCQLESLSRDEKEAAVKQLNSDMRFADSYQWWRIRIAAAAYSGANIDLCEKETNRGGFVSYDSPLIRALDHSDEPLIDLLLSNNASVKTPRILWHAYNRKIAQKLVDRGADVSECGEWNKNTILETVMQGTQYDADLVEFYKEKGLAYAAHREGLTPLHRLIIFHEPDSIVQCVEKFDALVKAMSCQGVLDILAAKTKTQFLTCPYDKNVIEILEKQRYYNPKKNFTKVIFYCYLLKVREDATLLLKSAGCKVEQQP